MSTAGDYPYPVPPGWREPPIARCEPEPSEECSEAWKRLSQTKVATAKQERIETGPSACPPGEGVKLCPPPPDEQWPVPRTNPSNREDLGMLDNRVWELRGKITLCPNRGGGMHTPGEKTTRVVSPPLPYPYIRKIIAVHLLDLGYYDGVWHLVSVNQDLAWAAYRDVRPELTPLGGGTVGWVMAAYFQNWSHNTDRHAAVNVIIAV